MKTPKRISVKKILSTDDQLNATRWTSFTEACQQPFESLSDEWLCLFVAVGYTTTTTEEFNRLIDASMKGDEK